MKFRSTLAIVAALSLTPLALTQCVVVEDPTSGTTESSVDGYAIGFQKGREDGRGGLSRTPDRYREMYSGATRADYFRGYEDGYNQGIR